MTDDLEDRLSQRFEGESDENDTTSQDDMNSTPSQTSQKAQNIKKAWNVRSFYLDDGLNTNLDTTFKRLDLDVSEAGVDIDLKKTRHFYPLVVELGLEKLESMDITEVTERLESKDFV